MARWKLTASHYIQTDQETEWEYTEVDRTNGRPKRHKFRVPTFLDINDPVCWTERIMGMDGKPVEGYINVSDGNNPGAGDVIFKGDPTPDMLPLDDEARAISDTFKEHWRFNVTEQEPGTFAQDLVDNLQRQLAAAQIATKPAEVQVPGLAEFMKTMAEIQAQNAAILAQVVQNQRRA